MDRIAFRSACATLGIELSADQMSALEAFECALYEANKLQNLTRVPQDACWSRHLVDSLLVAAYIPRGATVLDVGSGPGFPAWPLACARPDLAVTALDANGKMVAFLRSQPLPNLKVVQARAEVKPRREAYDVVTGRAVAPLAIQLELSAAPCKVSGLVLPMRTPHDEPLEDPIPALGLRLTAIHRPTLPGTDIHRVIPEYRKVAPTKAAYPRSWSDIRRSQARARAKSA